MYYNDRRISNLHAVVLQKKNKVENTETMRLVNLKYCYK